MSKPTIADQIRSLARQGLPRAEIARRVDRSYQQVRQVLVGDEARARRLENSGNPQGVDAALQAIDVSDLGTNKSARMRRYAQHGFRRADIARFMGVRYQFVRNVLEQADAAKAAEPGLSEDAVAFAPFDPRLPVRLVVDDTGALRLPPAWKVAPGTVFVGRNFGGEIVLMPARAAAAAGQLPTSEVDDFIAERRREAMREFND